MEKINVAVIGLGGRGRGNLKTILNIPGVEVIALCDIYEDRCLEGKKIVEDAGRKTPFYSLDYHEVLSISGVDAAMVYTSWETHIEIAIASMKAGCITALEVGGAHSITECWELVHTYEETKVPFFFLENCCYGRFEMLVRNIAADGILGDIVHCHGAYAHDLREEVSCGHENRHYRLKHYLARNCENYPTHELGPIAKILNINRGNRMVSLVSVASKSAGIERYINDRKDTFKNKNLIGQRFMQGDIVNTIITCENGETISLRLDTCLPRPYSREFTVRGTKGMYEENTNSIFLDGDEEIFESNKHYQKTFNNAERFYDKYMPDCWKNVTDEIIEAGHGGMDYFLNEAFFDIVRERKQMTIDVYDAAAWMAVTCLSEQSIMGGNVPVAVPDFTKGAYKTRKRLDV